MASVGGGSAGTAEAAPASWRCSPVCVETAAPPHGARLGLRRALGPSGSCLRAVVARTLACCLTGPASACKLCAFWLAACLPGRVSFCLFIRLAFWRLLLKLRRDSRVRCGATLGQQHRCVHSYGVVIVRSEALRRRTRISPVLWKCEHCALFARRRKEKPPLHSNVAQRAGTA